VRPPPSPSSCCAQDCHEHLTDAFSPSLVARSYVSTQEGLSDTLTHARKDGYLDRRDFLDRVEGAKERQYDEAKSSRRR